MSISDDEKRKRGICLLVATGLAGAGLDKQAKRVERSMGEPPDYLRSLFTTIEREPEATANAVRLLAYAKKALNGEETYLEKLKNLSWTMSGVVPEPTKGN